MSYLQGQLPPPHNPTPHTFSPPLRKKKRNEKPSLFKNDAVMWLRRPLPILGMGMVVLGGVLLLLLLTVKNKTKLDPLFYGSTKTHLATHFHRQRRQSCSFSLTIHPICVCGPVFAEFSFTCMVGLTNALEQSGFISGFMGFYIRQVWWAIAESDVKPHDHPSPSVNSQPFPAGGASPELRLRHDDVILGGRLPSCPLPHYHPSHV